jgi:hypothetical protein
VRAGSHRSVDGAVKAEAERLMAEHGKKALDIAREGARLARNKRSHRQARQYALMAAYIAEQAKAAE